MTARHRQRSLRTNVTGTYWSNIGPTTVTRTMQVGTGEINDDHVGNFTVVNPLGIWSNTESYPTLSGQLITGFPPVLVKEFTGFPIGYRPKAPDPRLGFPAYTTPQLSALAWQILAGTNPNTPHVSIPSFIGELKDFLSLIKGNGESVLDLFKGSKKGSVFLKNLDGWTWKAIVGSLSSGRKIVQQAAEGYISYRWALRPLYHDLMDLLRFTRAVDNRLMEMYALRDGKTLKRRVHLESSMNITAPTNVTLHSEGAIIDGTRQITYTSETWGTAQWKLNPSSKLPQLGYGPLKETAYRLAAGFTSHEALATAWQLMPWSWLIDWFAQIDDTIAATNNTLGTLWSHLALMRKTTSIVSYKVTAKPSWVVISDNYYTERGVRKDRYPVEPILPFTLNFLPILTNAQWSILGALATSRHLSPP